GRLLTQKERVRRGIGDGELCTTCGNAPENVIHVIRDCSVTKEVWYRLIPTAKRGNFFFESLQEWLESNLGNQYKIFLKDVDWIDEMIRSSYSWALQYIFSQKSLRSNKPTTGRSVTGEGNWVDLNIDGAMKLDSGVATVGGILKDSQGVRSLGLIGVWIDSQEAIRAIQESFSKTSSSTLI
ncbi:hypothetical protein Goarm_021588, partial [Gossypium armourianum]|nr:hypothetical protein [Gossypium armourianum]